LRDIHRKSDREKAIEGRERPKETVTQVSLKTATKKERALRLPSPEVWVKGDSLLSNAL
jgi:hypothetical protein